MAVNNQNVNSAEETQQDNVQDNQSATIANPCVVQTGDAAKDVLAPTLISRPEAGQDVEVVVQPGQNYIFNFDEADVASVVQQGGDLVMTFADGSVVKIINFGEASIADLPAVFAFSNTLNDTDIAKIERVETVDGVEETQEVSEITVPQETEEFQALELGTVEPAAGQDGIVAEVAQANQPTQEVAQELAEIEPAAGENATPGATTNTGFGFGSSFTSTGIIPLADIGPINPTALAFGLPEFPLDDLIFEDPGVIIAAGNGVPTLISPTSPSLDETLLGPLTVTNTIPVDFGADGPGELVTDGDFCASVNGVEIVLTSGGTAVDIQSTANGYTGTIPGATDPVFTLVVDPQTGEYTFAQHLPIDHPDATDPNDVINLKFGLVASDSDGDQAFTTLIVDIVDDAPVARDDFNVAEEGQMITGDLFSNDTFSNDEDNTLTQIEFEGTVFPIPAGGSATIPTTLGELIVNSDGTYKFTAVDVGDPDGDLVFTYTIVDGDGDPSSADLNISVTPDGEPLAVTAELTVDETNLTPGPLTTTGTANVDFGLDGPGTIVPNGVFVASDSVADAALTSGGEPVDVQPNANGDGYVGTITVGGVTTNVFTLVITDQVTGDFTFSLNQRLDHGDSTDPNDTINLNFGVTATDADGDSVGGSITVLVLDDAPVALDDVDTVAESETTTGNVITQNDIASEDTPTILVEVNFNGVTTSVPAAGATITGNFGTLTIQQDGSYSYTANSNNPDGVDVFGYVIQDFDGDQETADLTITVSPIDDQPIIVQNDLGIVDETDIPEIDPRVTSVSGQVVANFGTDAPGTIMPTPTGADDFVSSGSRLNDALTSNGETVEVTLSGTTYTGTANGVEIFNLDVDTDGNYTFELSGTLDHADPDDPNDIIRLDFPIKAVDADGDETPAVITINVLDDVPVIGDSNGDVDETGFNDADVITTSNTLFTDFGLDVASITPGGVSTATVNGTVIPLTSAGNAITVAPVGDSYVGTITVGTTTTTIFTLQINPDTGRFVYTQNAPIDHPDTTDANDIIDLNFSANVTALDGSTDTGTITISVADDGPVANDDLNNAEEGQLITGSFVSNDELSQDVANTITSITFDGTTTIVPANGSATIPTTLGTLTANSDGTYSFTAEDAGDPEGDLVFTYTLTDADGDSDTAELTISVTPDGEPVAVGGALTTDETALTPGPSETSGTIDVDFGLDGDGSVDPNDQFQACDVFGNDITATLSSGGELVSVNRNASGDGYVGTITVNGTTTEVFTLDITDTGTFDFTLIQRLDHADGTDPNDTIELKFGVTATDSDDDTVDGSIDILVVDDAPVAIDDTDTVEERGTTTGNVLPNDEASEDTPTELVAIRLNGVITPVPDTGLTIDGDFGQLTIQPNGDYSYTANDNVGAVTDVFEYIIQDFDGDQETADLSITIIPDDVPELADIVPLNVDETDKNPTDTDSNTVTADFGADGPGTFTSNDTFSSAGGTNNALTSNGDDVDVSLDGNDYVGISDNIEIFRLTLNETTGEYTFTLTGTLDHADTTDPDDTIVLNFGVTATDVDGDTDTGTIVVNVKDDGPFIDSRSTPVEESALANGDIVLNESLNLGFGQDGPAPSDQVRATGTFMALAEVGGTPIQLQSNGVNVVTTSTNDGYTGSAGGVVIYTLDVNDDGTYTYTQKAPIDHPLQGQTGSDDVIWLKFEVAIVDLDGDTATTNIIIDVRDDAPVAVDDTDTTDQGDQTSGNILDNDDLSTDVSNEITEIRFNGVGTTIPAAGVTIDGTFGQLVIQQDGSYTYTGGNAEGTDTFEYDLTDADGDTSTATLSLTVEPDSVPVAVNDIRTVNDGNSVSGNLIDNDTVGDDTPGTITSIEFGGTITTIPTGGSVTVTGDSGVLTVASDGTYNYVSNENDVAVQETDSFNYVLSDNDGDTAAAQLNITVRDNDAPIARNDIRSGVTGSVSGNILSNDTLSIDTPNTLDSITFGGVTRNIPTGGSVTINATSGTLTINSSGAFTFTQSTFTQNANVLINDRESIFRPGIQTVGRAGTNNFTYRISDNDGDVSAATLSIVTVQAVLSTVILPRQEQGGEGTPLVIDLDHDGVELVSQDNGVLFDLGADGTLDQTAWAAADDGFLALDVNNDGIINDHSELFGTLDTDGFTILAQHDENGDGAIDSNDAVFDDLIVWQDTNQNGYSEDTELFGLADFDIASINLDAALSDDVIEGSTILLDSTVTYNDGSEGQIVDALFNFNELDILYATEGQDTFIFDATNDNPVVIRDFNAEDGDVIDLTALIETGDDVTDAINNFVHVTEQGENTVVSVGEGEAAQTIAILQNFNGLTDDQIITDTSAMV